MTTSPNPSGPPEPARDATTPGTSGAGTAGIPSGPQPLSHPGAYGYPSYPIQRPTNGFAIASFVLGIAGIIFFVPGILALIFGYIARNQIKERHEGGSALAIAGIVLGWVVIGIFVTFFVIGFIGGVSSGR